MWLYLDKDDPALADYKLVELPDGWKVKVGPRIKPGPVYNLAFHEFPNEPYYGLLGDDVVPLTNHWDSKLIEVAGSDHLAYPDDLFCRETIATHPVIGGDLVRKVGFLSYGELKQYFTDTWWTFVSRALGLSVYCPQIVFDHMHHSTGKAPVDDTYRGKWPDADSDRAIYDAFVADPQTPAYIERLKG